MSGGGNEVMLAIAWLFATLSGDSTLSGYAPGGVHRGLAPNASSTPYIILAHMSGGDTTTANGFRLFSQPTFQVKAVGPATETGQLAAAALRLDQLLGGTNSGPASGPIVVNNATIGQMLACWRLSPLVIDELVNGEEWTNVGGLYQTQVQQITS